MMKKVPPEYRKYVRIIIFLIILITLADIIHPIRYYKFMWYGDTKLDYSHNMHIDSNYLYCIYLYI